MSIHLGGGARDPGCRVEVMVEHSTPDRLHGGEAYPGPVGKPGIRDMRRVCWYSGPLFLASKAPIHAGDVHRLWLEIAELGTRRMLLDPTASMLEAILP